MHRLYCYMAVIFVFFSNAASAQESVSRSSDSIKVKRDTALLDSLVNQIGSIRLDSLGNPIDSISNDSAKALSLEERLGIRLSKDALESVVTATAKDSAVMDMEKNIFYLYTEAKVNYEDMELNAGQITYNQSTNSVIAQPQFDSAGVAIARPTFTQGQEKIIYDSLQYNFKSKRAIVRNAKTQYGEGYMHSEQIKRNPDQSIYGLHNVYTTCALDTPHFGIVTRKVKVIPNRVAASGPANIAVEGVPTPLFLPFGLFPISQKQRSGFMLPTYTVEQARGLGLLNGGYYFAISDKMDLLTQVNIFSKGSWQATGTTKYSSIYRYNGSMQMNYAYNKTGETYEPGSSIGKDFMVLWSHYTDPKAKPGENFTASLQVGTSSFYSNTSYDPLLATQNQYQSNLSYNKTWPNKPYNLAVSARHSQNTGTGLVDVTLPQVAFNVASFSPFQDKNNVGLPKWYDKITLTYTLDAQNRTSFIDSTFNIADLRFNNGIVHRIPVQANYTLLRFINTSFNLPYTEYWMTERIIQNYNDAEGRLDSTVSRGFYTARDFNFNYSMNTRIFGTKIFKRGKLRGIRHILEPGVNFVYRPDFAEAPFNYYYDTRLGAGPEITSVSPFASSVIGSPPQGEQRTIGFGLNNNLQIKVRNSKDTATGYKNITLIDGFSINSGYNFAADSFQWQDISMSFRTNILDKVQISAGANYGQYGIDYQTGQRERQTMWQLGHGIGRFQSANIALNTALTSKPKTKDKTTQTDDGSNIAFNPDYYNYVDFDVQWSLQLSYSMNISNIYLAERQKDTIQLTAHNINFGGEFNITPRWKVGFTSSYNFMQKQLQATRIQIFRDLHCWAMRLETVPFGPLKNYNFTLNVKASVLQDLKFMRRRDFRDAVRY